jgi:hypothetical protein
MMKHLGGDYRGNYAYPKVYFGDWGEFISAQNPGDPQEEIGYLFGYDGDYQALVNDIKKYRAQPKEGEEVEMSSEEPAPTHQASPGQMNWAMQGDNPAETHYESKRGR